MYFEGLSRPFPGFQEPLASRHSFKNDYLNILFTKHLYQSDEINSSKPAGTKLFNKNSDWPGVKPGVWSTNF